MTNYWAAKRGGIEGMSRFPVISATDWCTLACLCCEIARLRVTKCLTIANHTSNETITFHCARYTFSIMMLTAEGDIYAISKPLRHSSIHKTEIYAGIVTQK